MPQTTTRVGTGYCLIHRSPEFDLPKILYTAGKPPSFAQALPIGSAKNLVPSAVFTRISTSCLPLARASGIAVGHRLYWRPPCRRRRGSCRRSEIPVRRPASGSTPTTATPLPPAPVTSLAGASVRPRCGTPFSEVLLLVSALAVRSFGILPSVRNCLELHPCAAT